VSSTYGASRASSSVVDSGTCGENLTWTLDSNGLLTISGTGEMTNFDWKNAPWYSYADQIVSCVIKSGVTTIGEYAFYDCANLVSVTIPSSVTNIGWCSFRNCTSLASAKIPKGVTTIDGYAFNNCTSLTSVVIPNSVTCISYYAFEACSSLTSVTIPGSVTKVDVGAFHDCSSLASVTISNGITSIADSMFKYCESLASITIPNSVTSIGKDAFFYCKSLTSITIPDSVTSIGKDAFYYCTSLTSIELPNSFTSIGDYTFYFCRSLDSITIPNSVTSIGSNAFYNCSNLTSLSIPDSVTSVGDYAFYKCYNLNTVTIPASVTSIGEYAFGYIYEDSTVNEFTVQGHTGSVAQTYAEENGFSFIDCNSITYKVKYDGNGATSGTMKASKKSYGKTSALRTNAFARTGYTFAGWNTAKDGSGTTYADQASVKNLTTTNGETVTLYAQWTANTYKIKFDGNGATSGSMKSKSMTYDTAANLTANAYKRTGYTFAGWNTKADGTGKTYKNKASVKNLTSTDGKTVKLYAQWTANTYKIKFDGNGATSGSMKSKSMTYDTAANLTANAYKRTGYTFAGWNTKADGTGKSYKNKASIQNLTSTDGKTITLYAQWKKK
jgi:uncharacterized repeat protein (TIGR02543 family)